MPSLIEPAEQIEYDERPSEIHSSPFTTPTSTTTATNSTATNSSVNSQYAPNRTTSPVSFRNSGGSWKGPLVSDNTNPQGASPWDQQLILTIDGGGVRGYASLLILEALMQQISEIEKNEDIPANSSEESPLYRSKISSERGTGGFKPCHYFDLIGGTGMGGLIAIMVGRLRQTATQARDNFEKILHKMQTQSPRFVTARKSRTDNSRRLKSAISRTLSKSDYEGVSESTPFLQDDRLCKTAVLTMLIDRVEGVSHPFLLRTYRSRKTDPQSDYGQNALGSGNSPTLIQACLASTAAPSYMRSVRMDGQKLRDGSIWTINPGMEIYRDVESDKEKPVQCMISIGYDQPQSSNTRLQKQVPEMLESRRLRSRQQCFYERFSCPDPLADPHAKDWKINSTVEDRILRIQESTFLYLKTQKKNLKLAAEELVFHRRRRCRSPGWERYAFAVAYKCNICVKTGESVSELDHDQMVNHIFSVHRKISRGINGDSFIIGADRDLYHVKGILDDSRTPVDSL